MKKIIIAIVCIICVVCLGGIVVFLVSNKNEKSENKEASISENITSKNKNNSVDKIPNEDEMLGDLQEIADKYTDIWCDEKSITRESYSELAQELNDMDPDGMDIDIQIQREKKENTLTKEDWSSRTITSSDVYDEISCNEVLKEIKKNGAYDIEESDIVSLVIGKDGVQAQSMKMVSD